MANPRPRSLPYRLLVAGLCSLALATPAWPEEDQDVGSLLEAGRRLEAEGKWFAAYDHYERAVRAADETEDSDPEDVAAALIRYADLCTRLKDPNGIIARAPLVRAKKLLGGTLPADADSLLLGYETNLEEAEERARAHLASVEQEHGAESLQTARALDLIAWAQSLQAFYGREVQPDRFRPGLDRALVIKTRHLPPGHPSTAWTETCYGLLCGKAGLATEARDRLTRAHVSFDRAFGLKRFISCMPLWGTVLLAEPDPQELPQLMARAVIGTCEDLGPQNPVTTSMLLHFAHEWRRRFQLDEYHDLGDFLAACLAANEAEAKALDVGTACRAVSDLLVIELYNSNGQREVAGRVAHEAIDHIEVELGPDNPVLSVPLDRLAWSAISIGDFETAESAARRNVAIVEKAGPGPYELGRALNTLASALKEGREEEREEVLGRAVELWSQALGPDSDWVAAALANRCATRERLGNEDGAYADCARAAAIEETSWVDLSDSSFERFGTLLLRRGKLEEAQRYLERALERYADDVGPDSQAYARASSTLAAVLAARGNLASAFDLSLSAAAATREETRLAVRSLPERVALNAAVVRRWGLDQALVLATRKAATGDRSRLLDEVIRSRGVVLDELAGRRRLLAASSQDPETRALTRELARATTRYANCALRGPEDLSGEQRRKLLDRARERKEQAEEALAQKSLVFARSLASARIGIDDVRKALPPGSALLAYVRYDAGALAPRFWGVPANPDGEEAAYLAFVLRRGASAPVLHAIGSAKVVDGAVERWREAVSLAGSEEAARQTGEALRRLSWTKVAQSLEDVQQVFIVPDGALQLVSFGALPGPDGSYLIERGPRLHYLSSERDLAIPAPEKRQEAGLLAIGNPAFDDRTQFVALRDDLPARSTMVIASVDPTDLVGELETRVSLRGRRSGCGRFGSLRFESLPGSSSEVGAIAALWGERAKLLSGVDASETAAKGVMAGHSVLHIATHGFFLGGACVGTPGTGARGIGGLKISRPEEQPAKPESPLLLSGLALAGANHREHAGPDEDDGILTAEEIAALNLSGVEWAVLSACDTGVGDIKAGEGVFGLRRAFQIAGARTLIMSLWSVDDESTREWMTALYEGRLEEKLDTAEAVRQASLKVLERRREAGESTHPFYWAAFVAAGDWR